MARLSDSAGIARLNSLAALLDAGSGAAKLVLRIKTNAALTVALSGPAFQTPTISGDFAQMVANAVASGSSTLTGVLDNYLLTDSDDNTVMSGTIGESSSSLLISDTDVTAGKGIDIDSITIRVSLISGIFSILNVLSVQAGAEVLYPNGIEAGVASTFESPSGNTDWYVDFEALDGGNGTHGLPYNSFEVLEGLIQGGDYIHITGTADFTNHDDQVNKLTLELDDPLQGGTLAEPTVIKSWKGVSQALFDGAGVAVQNAINIRNLGASGAVEVHNIAFTRITERGINVGTDVKYAKTKGIVGYDNDANGFTGTAGVVHFNMSSASYVNDFEATYCTFRNNTLNPTGSEDNQGALSVTSEVTAATGSALDIEYCKFEGEVIGIRQKHSGNITMTAKNNYFKDCKHGFYTRALNNDLRTNRIENCQIAFWMQEGSANGNLSTILRNNEAIGVGQYIKKSGNMPTDPDTSLPYTHTIENFDNIITGNDASKFLFNLAEFGSNDFDLANYSGGGNQIRYADETRAGVYQGTAHNHASLMSLLGDTTSVQG